MSEFPHFDIEAQAGHPPGVLSGTCARCRIDSLERELTELREALREAERRFRIVVAQQGEVRLSIRELTDDAPGVEWFVDLATDERVYRALSHHDEVTKP